MKRLLTYGLLLLTILASHFVVSACQDDLPETTEVMMTFTTRAVVSDIISSDAPDEDKMKDLRVIMLRQDGTVVDNHLEEDINASSVTFTFSTPIQTGGEDFTFLAVANEESIQSSPAIDWLNCLPGENLSGETIAQIKAQKIGNREPFDISDGPIPQTKQWTVHVPQQDSHVENQTLDFVASKISVQFINNTNAEQSLSNIKITGIGYNVYGYLFAQNTDDFVGEGHADTDITFTDVTNLAAGATSATQTYYTYPVGSLSSPTLHATWDGVEKTLPIMINDQFITALNRNDHLQIVVTLTDIGLDITYAIANWVNNQPTYIGQSPSIGDGGYDIPDWGDGTDVEIGGDPVVPDEPEEPGGNEPGGETPIGGSILWSGTETLKWSNLPIKCEAFNDLDYDVTTSHKIRISFQSSANNTQLQFLYGDGSKGMPIPELNNSNSTGITSGTTYFEFTISEAMLKNFIGKNDADVAFYVRSDQLTITEVLLFLPETE